MTDNSPERAASQRLSCYKTYASMLEAGSAYRENRTDRLILQTEMFDIRRSVTRLPQTREKIFLYTHYIRGETMEKTAELMGISRRSVFRMQLRALSFYIKQEAMRTELNVFES